MVLISCEVRNPLKKWRKGIRASQRGGVRDQRQVLRLLHRVGSEQRKAGGACCHDIGMVAENRQCLRRERARRHVKYRRASVLRQFCTYWGS